MTNIEFSELDGLKGITNKAEKIKFTDIVSSRFLAVGLDRGYADGLVLCASRHHNLNDQRSLINVLTLASELAERLAGLKIRKKSNFQYLPARASEQQAHYSSCISNLDFLSKNFGICHS